MLLLRLLLLRLLLPLAVAAAVASIMLPLPPLMLGAGFGSVTESRLPVMPPACVPCCLPRHLTPIKQ